MTSSFFCPNVGPADRAVRIVIGLALIALVFMGPMTPFGWVGVIPLMSGLLGWCGLYSVLKISTCKTGNCCTKESEGSASSESDKKSSCCGGGCH